MSKFTKQAIMNSFMKLLNEMPFDKITVKDIADDCGINRNTFYYNFQDIYALVDEILQNEINRLAEMHKNPYPSWSDGLLSVAEFALKNKKAIYHLHNSVKRHQLDKYLEKAIYGVVSEFVFRKAENRNIAQESLEFVAAFYCYALLGLVSKWIDTGMQEDFGEVLRKTGILFDVNIDNAIDAVDGKKMPDKTT